MNDWDRQPCETSKAFHAFEHYRDMPPADRSIDAAHAEHLAQCERRQRRGKRGSNTWHGWSSANRWVGRAATHDADLGRRRRERSIPRVAELQGRAIIAWNGVRTRRISTMGVSNRQ